MFQGQELATSSKSKSCQMWKFLDWKTFHFWQLQGFGSFGIFYYQMPYECTALHSYLIVLWCYQNWLYINHLFPAYPDMTKLAQYFDSTPHYISLWVLISISGKFRYWIFVIHIVSSDEFLPNLADKPIPLCKLIYSSIKIVDIFAKYGKYRRVKTVTAYAKMCSTIIFSRIWQLLKMPKLA